MRRLTRAFSVFLMAACPVSGCTQETIVYQPAEMQADLEKFGGALMAVHPGTYTHQTPAEFQLFVDELQKQASEPLAASVFYRLVLKLVAGVHDGHTQAYTFGSLSDELDAHPQLPFEISASNERLFVVRDLSSEGIPEGSELLAIGGLLSNQILHQLLEHYSSDGASRSGMYDWLGGPYRPFRRLHAEVLGANNSYEVVYRNTETNDVITTQIEGMTQADFEAEAVASSRSSSATPPDAFSFITNEDEGYAHMRITRLFKDDFDEPDSTFPDFYAASFREIADREIGTLIVDLRDNGGGKASNAAYLLQYFIDQPLKPAKEITALGNDEYFRTVVGEDLGLDSVFGLRSREDGRFEVARTDVLRDLMTYEPAEEFGFGGRLIVLINGGTTSAGAIAAGLLKEHAGAILVGEETYGYAGISNGVRNVRVRGDHTETAIYLPILHAEYEVPTAVGRRPVVPDHHVSPAPHDVLTGNDAVLQFVRARLLQEAHW